MERNRSGKAIMIIIIAVLVLALLGGVAVFVMKPKGHKKEKPVKLPSTMVEMGDLVVNLADTNEVRYLKTSIVIEVQGTLAEAQVEDATTVMRDSVIEILSSKKYVDLNTPKGKAALKKEILKTCSEALEEFKPESVYFKDFAMQ